MGRYEQPDRALSADGLLERRAVQSQRLLGLVGVQRIRLRDEKRLADRGSPGDAHAGRQGLHRLEPGAHGAFGAPAGLAATDSTNSSVALAWTGVGGAAGYNVYRATCSTCAFSKANAALVTSPSYADGARTAST